MIKDFVFKLVCIPLIGSTTPVVSSVILYNQLSVRQIIFSNLFFIVASFFSWQGTVAIISRLRTAKVIRHTNLPKLLALCLAAGLYAAGIAAVFTAVWQKVFLRRFDENTLLNYCFFNAGIMMFIALVYEVLFLKKEVELDTKIVDQLDAERQNAELNMLKNELDPHFIFNSLTSLAHLITTDTDKAQLFTQKLAQAYKYLLINKDRELITLAEELRFIDNYFFLLRIRHDNKLKLEVDVDERRNTRIMILPCSLQLLIENAIKHNMFTEENPLVIKISLNEKYLYVTNNVQLKPYLVESTNIGLKNLSTRYRLTCHKDIIVSNAPENFIVKLPVIQ